MLHWSTPNTSITTLLLLFDYEVKANVLTMTHSQLLEGLKCEFKWKTAEEGGVGTRSLAHNTWGVEGRVGAPGWD
jgi:hypothetical protein